LSWTPNEFRDFCRGAQHAQIDQYELAANSAMFARYAQNAKHARLKRMFDAEKAHRRIDKESGNWKESRSPGMPKDKYRRLKAGLSKAVGTFQKGG
jgi:hypothetical protein